MKNKYNLSLEEIQILNNFSNFDKYIEKLLELSPIYFKGFIDDFNNNFNLIKIDDEFYDNNLDASFLINIKNLQKSSKDIFDFLRKLNENDKECFELKKTNYNNEEYERIHKNLQKLKTNFGKELLKALEIINNENIINEKNREKTINLETFSKFNDIKKYENYGFMKNLDIVLKNRKYYNKWLFIILFSLSIFLFFLFLLLFFMLK